MRDKKNDCSYLIRFSINYYIISLFLFFLNLRKTRTDVCRESNTTYSSQLLNNIICIKDQGRFINIATFSNGDLVVETNKPHATNRTFYGIDSNGKPLMENDQYYLSIEVKGKTTNEQNQRNHSENFIAIIDNKEYLISVSQSDRCIELYNLTNSKIESQEQTIQIFSKYIENDRGSATKYTGSNSILFTFFSDDTVYLNKLNFISKDIKNNNPVKKSKELFNSKGKSVSCFTTDTNFIMCLTIHKRNSFHYMYINAYDNDLVEKNNIYFDDFKYQINVGEDYFSKCIHLEKEAGIFSFIYRNNEIYSAVIMFKYFKSDTNEIKDYYEVTSILLDKKNLSYNCLLNDVVKTSNKSLCFISTSITKEELYFVLINIINKNQIFIRYYSIPIFEEYNFKLFTEMRAHIYNNYIAFAFNLQSNFTSNQNYYAAFMVFNYANGTDYYFELIDYLFQNNDLDNLIIDLKEHVRIDNNIFGYIYSGIQIKKITNCDNFTFYSSIDTNMTINSNYILNENEKIKVSLNSYNINICSLNYIYIITESIFENNIDLNETIIQGTDNIVNYNKNNDTYESRVLNYYLIIDKELETECLVSNCKYCLKNNTNYCIICNYNYSIIIESNSKNKICFPDPDSVTEKVTEQSTESVTEKAINPVPGPVPIDLKNCTKEQILNNECIKGRMNNEQVDTIYKAIVDDILKDDYKGKNTVIQTENVVFQLSKYEDQKNNENPIVSSIDLLECEKILKTKYNISQELSLIVIKTDIKSTDLKSTYVQYEIFHPNTLDKLNLEFCKEVKIEISAPVKLEYGEIALINSVSESGYNPFNSEDDFYNDICSIYTSENGTDMTLEDRQKEIYGTTNNLIMCQNGCKVKSYNKETNKSKCECDIQKNSTNTNISNIDFSKENLISTVLGTLNNINLLVLKCFKLALSIENILKNKGRIIMTILYLLFIISLIIYVIKDRGKINMFIKDILYRKNNMKELSNKDSKNDKNTIKDKVDKKNCKEKMVNKKEIHIFKKNKKKGKNKIIINQNIAKKSKNEKNQKLKLHKNATLNINKNANTNKKNPHEPPKIRIKSKNKNKKDVINSTSAINSSNSISNLKSKSHSRCNKININIIPIQNINCGKNSKKERKSSRALINKSNTIKKNSKKKSKYLYSNDLNDQELNNLEYEIAVIIDKRTYFQYYCSLLRKKHLILFTFLPAKDYNLLTLKFSLFLLSISLYFVINALFFNDDTMHKIHVDHGSFNFIVQISQILYSSVISATINIILKTLSLSEQNILDLKKVTIINYAITKSKEIRQCIAIKFVIFFVLSNILLLFFWYYISCFCAVYTNTQIILIKDTLISFAFSMSYPFGLNLLPGFFRIPALREKSKNKKCIYQISGIISLF